MCSASAQQREWKGDRPAVWRQYFQKLAAVPDPGIFVDVGAGDGAFMSNTAFLEGAQCWRGLTVEPTDNEYPKLERNRPGATTVRPPFAPPPARFLFHVWSGSRSQAAWRASVAA